MDSFSKDLMALAVETALREMGPVEFEMVTALLERDFQKSLEDCFESPIFLKIVLCELFGNAYDDILSSIGKSFEKVNLDNNLINFLTVMKS